MQAWQERWRRVGLRWTKVIKLEKNYLTKRNKRKNPAPFKQDIKGPFIQQITREQKLVSELTIPSWFLVSLGADTTVWHTEHCSSYLLSGL